jgi:hypothetical protein
VALGQVFSEYFGFPCQLSFHRLLHIHHLSSGAGTIVPIMAYVPSGLSLTPPEETTQKKNKNTLASCSNLPLIMPFCFTMNYRNKDTSYKAENITVKYLNCSCADATKPVRQSKLSRYYKIRTKEWKNYSKTQNKTRFLTST